MELVDGACKERLYPVGRLQRQTTGLLLFTNDGEIAKKLTNPKHGVKKIYHVLLDKNLKSVDLKKIVEGVTLEEGTAYVEAATYIKNAPKEKSASKYTEVKTVQFVEFSNTWILMYFVWTEFTLRLTKKRHPKRASSIPFRARSCQC